MSSGYLPGQILTATGLNESFDEKVDSANATVTGGYMEGLDHVYVIGTTPSTSPTTGAVVVVGGVGVSGNVQVGGNIVVVGSAYVSSTTDTTTPTTGAAVVSGGVGVGKSVQVGGSVSVGGSVNVAGVINANDSVDSSSTVTGAIVVAGGVGIAKTLRVGANTVVGGNLVVTTGSASIGSTAPSTSISTGALVVAGGAGIGGALYANGPIYSSNGLNIKGSIILDAAAASSISGAINTGGPDSSRPSSPSLWQTYYSNTYGPLWCTQVTPTVQWTNAAGAVV
jgi:hypothetical protein